MTEAQVVVRNLSKTYRVPQRQPGLKAAIKGLARRTVQDVPAVRDITFDVAAGEMVGFIGPNGAGKTTALKMLSGLLHPTGGEARIAGFIPWDRNRDFLRRISMVMGNKSQMMWDIPPLDTFRVLGDIYRVPGDAFNQTLDELTGLLDMQSLLTKPVRNLSLGERMKCELVAALLHRPDVLFLDEPTLGLDVSMQRRLRRFIAEYNHRSGATIILTSHYMADVVELCPRVILIHHGSLLYDGPLQGLGEQLAPFKLIRLTLADAGKANVSLPAEAHVVECENGRLTLRVERRATPSVTARLLSTLPVADLAVEDPPIEAVMDRIYQEGSV
jgi:ABC-2 type transport system ATP-binding protein